METLLNDFPGFVNRNLQRICEIEELLVVKSESK